MNKLHDILSLEYTQAKAQLEELKRVEPEHTIIPRLEHYVEDLENYVKMGTEWVEKESANVIARFKHLFATAESVYDPVGVAQLIPAPAAAPAAVVEAGPAMIDGEFTTVAEESAEFDKAKWDAVKPAAPVEGDGVDTPPVGATVVTGPQDLPAPATLTTALTDDRGAPLNPENTAPAGGPQPEPAPFSTGVTMTMRDGATISSDTPEVSTGEAVAIEPIAQPSTVPLEVGTVQYSDGTYATGVLPLPSLSPYQQDGVPAPVSPFRADQ